ncbi:MAG: transposase [Planctomycetes bacterium]|nr:transposase [Planctomycetota bacterium]
MSRALRVEFPGAIYHLISRGVARMPTFLEDADRTGFLAILVQKVEACALTIHAFCRMPNHYHCRDRFRDRDRLFRF